MAQKAYVHRKRPRLPVRRGLELEEAQYLTTRELTALLHVTDWALVRWRREGDGPPYLRIGRRSIRYFRPELEQWLAMRKENRACPQL